MKGGDADDNDTTTVLNVRGGEGVGTCIASTGDRDVDGKMLAQILCEHLILKIYLLLIKNLNIYMFIHIVRKSLRLFYYIWF